MPLVKRTRATLRKAEFGFLSATSGLSDQGLGGGVLVKATPTANSRTADFALGVFDSDDNISLDLIVKRGSSVGAGDQEGGPGLASLSAGEPFTVTLSITEGGGSRLWLNGAPIAKHQAAYGTVQSTEYPLASPYGALSIWLFMQNRAATYENDLAVDYIRAWQERVARP